MLKPIFEAPRVVLVLPLLVLALEEFDEGLALEPVNVVNAGLCEETLDGVKYMQHSLGGGRRGGHALEQVA